MYRKVTEFIKENNMLDGCGHIVAGLSGGADSVCLLYILKKITTEYHIGLTAVHVHHGIRGNEADRDRDFCRKFCSDNGIVLKEFYYDVPEFAAANRMTEEEAGRFLRYKSFENVTEDIMAGPDCHKGTVKIAVAHHMNDRAETVLFNICRGTGLKGIRGILPVRDNIIRPLLNCTRQAIEEFLENEGLQYCNDSTNDNIDYTRNKIRHNVIPYMQREINGNTVENIASLAEKACEAEAYLAGETEKLFCENAVISEDGIKINHIFDMNPFMAKRLIIRGIEETGIGLKDIEAAHIDRVLKLDRFKGGAVADIKRGLAAERNGDGIFLFFRDDAETLPCVDINVPSCIDPWCRGENFMFSVEPWENNEKISTDIYTKYFDYDKIKVGLQLRTRRDGDCITIDSDGHHKKLNQYFIDEKVPKRKRDMTILLADGNNIVWVIGGRIGAEYKITGGTKRVLKVKYGGKTHGES